MPKLRARFVIRRCPVPCREKTRSHWGRHAAEHCSEWAQQQRPSAGESHHATSIPALAGRRIGVQPTIAFRSCVRARRGEFDFLCVAIVVSRFVSPSRAHRLRSSTLFATRLQPLSAVRLCFCRTGIFEGSSYVRVRTRSLPFRCDRVFAKPR